MLDMPDMGLRSGPSVPTVGDDQVGLQAADYACFFSLVPGLLCIADQARRFTHINPALEQVLGYKEDELLARSLLDFVHSDDRAATVEVLEKLGSGMPTVSFENRYRHKNGTYTWLAWTCSIPTASNAIYMVAHDLSAHKRREHELSVARAIVTSLGKGVYALDAVGQVRFMNPAAEHMLGWTEAELLGQNMHEMLRARRVADAQASQEASPLLGPDPPVMLHVDEDIFTRKDGTTFPVDYTRTPLVIDGRVEGVVVGFHDVTERKRTERALREQNAFARLLQVVAVAANESWTADEPLQRCLDHVCAQTGWPVGHVYLHDATTGALLPTTLWHLDDPERFATFRAITERTTLGVGDGLPGQVLATGKPAWIADATVVPDTVRVRDVMDLGIRAGFAFPVLVGTEVVAVLEFFSAEVAELDEPLAEVMTSIGRQIGRVGERSRAQQQLQAVAAQLERSNRELQDFAAVASHDLQEPLRKIQAFGDRLVAKYSATLGPDGRDYL